VERPARSLTAVGSASEVYVSPPRDFDLDAESGRLSGQLAKLSKELMGVSRKLQNTDFVERAPAEVVERERARREELTAREAKLKETLALLADLRGGDSA
jgi:valyl-tRNA synthetase